MTFRGVDRRIISDAQAGGFTTLDSDTEYRDMLEAWSCANDFIDVFVVQAFNYGGFNGLSPARSPGPRPRAVGPTAWPLDRAACRCCGAMPSTSRCSAGSSATSWGTLGFRTRPMRNCLMLAAGHEHPRDDAHLRRVPHDVPPRLRGVPLMADPTQPRLEARRPRLAKRPSRKVRAKGLGHRPPPSGARGSPLRASLAPTIRGPGAGVRAGRPPAAGADRPRAGGGSPLVRRSRDRARQAP